MFIQGGDVGFIAALFSCHKASFHFFYPHHPKIKNKGQHEPSHFPSTNQPNLLNASFTDWTKEQYANQADRRQIHFEG